MANSIKIGGVTFSETEMIVPDALAPSGEGYYFTCKTWESRTHWGHVCTLWKNGVPLNSFKLTYLNRTWEKYQYHDVICSCVKDYIKQLKERDSWLKKDGEEPVWEDDIEELTKMLETL